MKVLKNKPTTDIRNIALHLIKRWLVICFWVYVGLGAVLFVFQTGYIYHPGETAFQDCASFKNAEKISSGSSRGYFTKRSQEKVIVFYHGNAGSACDRDYLDSFFAEQNYSTYFVEYSGYGETGNKPSMQKLLKNVDDTIDFLKTEDFRHITVVGESVGVGLASYHALHSPIGNLILITAYSNLASVAFSHYPVYPMRLLLLNNFTPDTWLSQYEGQVSVILAGDDEVIPNKFGRRLYENIPSNLKKMYIVENAGHNTIYEKEEFYSDLGAALK
ncbi:MAG: alpha/beta hydrolase [Candidatus Pacebacteria bacterium]|nr:alpha/beta hydrolase [Candidatus Paceibacterota bacterium]